MFNNPLRRRYPLEFDEIARKIASKKPVISWDDISDLLLDMWEKEKKFKKEPGNKKRCAPFFSA